MKKRISLLIAAVVSLCLATPMRAGEGGFETSNITGNIYFITDPGGGESQLVIKSGKGLVVFDTFWSEITARKYKEAIAAALGSDDFTYVINMVDRLDMFGGNAAYKNSTIVGHAAFLDKYEGKEAEVNAEISRLIEMWRWKEKVSRERLPQHEPGSDREKGEIRWMNTCGQRAEELEKGFSLVLPSKIYRDRMTLDLGDMTLELIWFGKAGYDGMTIAVVPEEKVAIIPGFIMHSQHLAPYPQGRYATLDVPRWIAVLEELLTGENAVEKVICDISDVWTVERARTHLDYIKALWERVEAAEERGETLAEISDRLSLDNEFSFVKKMQVYIDHGDDWVRPQHQSHVRLFYLQHKNLACEMIRREGKSSISDGVRKVRDLRAGGGDVYVDETSMNDLGYDLLGRSRFSDAIEVLNLNAEAFPQSANAYDSLAEAYAKGGDTEKAVMNYKKSLELNPKNDNAREMLKKLGKE